MSAGVFTSLHTLQPELRIMIWEYLSTSDLKNVARCNKLCHNDVKPYVWHTIKVEWNNFESRSEVRKLSQFVTHTKEIRLRFKKRCSSNTRGSFSNNFNHFLSHCDNEKILRLSFCKAIKRMSDGKHPSEACVFDGLMIFVNLQKLTFKGLELDVASMKIVGQLHQLEELNFHCCFLNGEAMRCITNLENMKRLTMIEMCLYSNQYPTQYLDAIARLKNLVELDYPECIDNIHGDTYDMTDSFTKLFRSLTKLEVLKLPKSYIPVAAMEYLTSNTALRELDLSAVHGGWLNNKEYGEDRCERDMFILAEIAGLEVLNISGHKNVNDESLLRLTSYESRLRQIDISNCRVSNNGLSNLCAIKTLQSINAYGCPQIKQKRLADLPEGILVNKDDDVVCPVTSSILVNSICPFVKR